MSKIAEILLKHGQMIPNELQINLQWNQQLNKYQKCILTIRIAKSHGSCSQTHKSRKYIFAIEQIQEQQTDFIEQGQSYDLSWIQKPGIYNFHCVNYPNLKCTINAKHTVSSQPLQLDERDKISPTRISLTNLQAVQQERQDKQQQLKQQFKQQSKERLKQQLSRQQFTSQQNIQTVSQQLKFNSCQQIKLDSTKFQLQKNRWIQDDLNVGDHSDSPFGTPQKANLSDYDKILSSVNGGSSENIQNRYLKYFQEQFKLWRNFFVDEEEHKKDVEILDKQKPKSERQKNCDNDIKQQAKQQNWSKRQNFSPTLLYFTESCGTPSNNQNLSEFQQQKSVGSYLYSHQEMHDRVDEQLYDKQRKMKKTNSEYHLAIQDIFEEKETVAESDKKRNSLHSRQEYKQRKAKNIMDWVDAWCEKNGQEIVKISRKEDSYIAAQWLAHLKNKYKLAKFIYE